MFRIRAKRRYKQYYLEHLAKGETSEVSADLAMTETKKEMRAILDSDAKISQSRKDRLWATALDELVDWQMLLIDLPQVNCQKCRDTIKQTLEKMDTLDVNNPMSDE